MGQKPNRLIREQSPYLQQHAHNPVDWYPWGEEALNRAREEDKPVFLSVGYSTCHWCHVMAHESFDNPHIAEILNRWFISVKVDREERPDIDQLYMTATQAMTGGGGWPMSVFLFPDGKPFYAGTYFPPESRYGRPGFGDLLTAIHEAWEARREDLKNVAGRLFREIAGKGQGRKTGAINDAAADDLLLDLREGFDPEYGGFYSAPKFPRPVVFNFLLQHWLASGQEPALEMVLATLRHMIRGGIHDHLGGGFHRYATDTAWLVPHFEKMLYDQALLASSCTDAFLITGNKLFADTVRGICTYVLRDLTNAQGGLYSAEDADSEDPYQPGRFSEGAFYLWTEREIASLLPAEDSRVFCFCYGVKAAGNVSEDPHGEFQGKNILYLRREEAEAAKEFKLSKSRIQDVLDRSRLVLFEARSRRKRPHLDDKVLVSWNGLMIGALARAGIVCRQPEWTEGAAKAARFIENELYNKQTRVLFRRYRRGEAGIGGQLDDYAFLVSGLLALHQATQNPHWLEWAVILTQTQINLFRDSNGGGFYDGADDSTLPCRMKNDYDGAEPTGNSVAAQNLLHLSALTSNEEWRRLALQTMEAFSGILNAQPQALPQMLCTWEQSRRRPRWVIVAGPPGREDTVNMLSAAFSSFEPGRIVLHADNGPNQRYLSGYLPFLKDLTMVDELAAAHVCEDFTCRLPVSTPEALASLLRTARSAGKP